MQSTATRLLPRLPIPAKSLLKTFKITEHHRFYFQKSGLNNVATGNNFVMKKVGASIKRDSGLFSYLFKECICTSQPQPKYFNAELN